MAVASGKGGATPNRERLAALLQQFKLLEASGAAANDHPNHEKRNQTLDELQDVVGLSGRMVMERDIISRANRLLGSL